MSPLSLSTALGAMSLLKDNSLNANLQNFGLNESDFDVLTQDTPWVAQQREQVRRTIDCIIHGLMDIVGVPRFEVPAEYIAAVLSTFVSGANMLIACRYMEGGSRAEELAVGNDNGERVKPQQLFALICQLRAGDAAVYEAFAKKVGARIEKSTDNEKRK